MLHQKNLLRALPIFLLLVFTWFRASAMLSAITEPDPGLFEAMAYHLSEGKTLYTDIWDHKPPGIFFLNAGFIYLLGPSEDAVSYGSLFFCLLQTLVFYLLLQRIFKNTYVSLFGTCIFILGFFSPEVFGSGNYTEQYAVLCTSTGLLFFLKYLENKTRNSILFSGIFFAIAYWFKEPFVFSSLPFFAYLAIQSIRDKETRKTAFFFGVGFIIPIIVVANSLVFLGSWQGYKDHLVYSRIYAKYAQSAGTVDRLIGNIQGLANTLPIPKWLYITCYFGGLACIFLNKNLRVIGLLLLGQQLADYWATSLSGNRFFHYYMQTFPVSHIILLAFPATIISLITKKENHMVSATPVLAIFLAMVLLIPSWRKLDRNPKKKFADPIAAYLDTHEFYKPRSVAMGGKDIGFYLLRVQGISAQRCTVPSPYHWVAVPGKEEHYFMKQDAIRFKNHMPDYVIYSGVWAEMYADCGLDSFVLRNYVEVAQTEMAPGKMARLLKRDKSLSPE